MRDLDILPRDGQTDRTWQLLFTHAADSRAREAQLHALLNARHASPTRLELVPGRSNLQWLHLPPWYRFPSLATGRGACAWCRTGRSRRR